MRDRMAFMAPSTPSAIFWVVLIAIPIVLLTYLAIADGRWYYLVVVLLGGFFEYFAIRRLLHLARQKNASPDDPS